MTTALDVFRLYTEAECATTDGYPLDWHRIIKHAVREEAGHRCLRCRHPYRVGAHESGEWTPCDKQCTHIDGDGGTHALWRPGDGGGAYRPDLGEDGAAWRLRMLADGMVVESAWRILTVHHLDRDKGNCRWWNLAAVCQRDHLYLQGRVRMEQVWPWEHSEWFRPYAAGFYAWKYLGLELSRAETLARLDELLALEKQAGVIL